MIINCDNCNKKFNINDTLIPERGRLLQCGSCGHKWFFTKNNMTESNDLEIKNNISHDELKNNNLKPVQKKSKKKEIENKLENLNNKNIKKNSLKLFNNLIIIIITIIALIIVLDTFENYISKILPGITPLLDSLFETLIDIKLFFKDLIN